MFTEPVGRFGVGIVDVELDMDATAMAKPFEAADSDAQVRTSLTLVTFQIVLVEKASSPVWLLPSRERLAPHLSSAGFVSVCSSGRTAQSRATQGIEVNIFIV